MKTEDELSPFLSWGRFQTIAYGLAFSLVILPYILLGKLSFMAVGENISSSLSFILTWTKGIQGFMSWFPWVNGGLDAESAGVTTDLALLIFTYLPPWPGYQLFTLAKIGLCAGAVFWIARRVLGLSPPIAWPAAMIVIADGLINVVFSDNTAFSFIVSVPIGMMALHYGGQSVYDRARLCAMAGLMGLAYGLASGFSGLISWYFMVPWVVIACLVQLSWVLRLSLIVIFMVGFLGYIGGEIASIIEKSALSHRTLMEDYSINTLDHLTLDSFIGSFRGIILSMSLVFAPFVIRQVGVAGRIFIVIPYVLMALLIGLLVGLPLIFDDYPFLKGVNSLRLKGGLENLAPLFMMVVIQGMIVRVQAASGAYAVRARLLARALVLYAIPVFIVGYLSIQFLLSAAVQWLYGGNVVVAYENPLLQDIADETGGRYRVDMVNPSFGPQPLAYYGLETVGGYVNIYPARYWHFFSMIETPERGDRSVSRYLKARYKIGAQNELYLACDRVEDHSLVLEECMDLDILALFNVRYLISRNPMRHAMLRLVEGPGRAWHSFSTYEKIMGAITENFGAKPHLFVYEVEKVQPRAFLVGSVEIVDDWSALKSVMNERSVEELKEKALILAKDAQVANWQFEVNSGEAGKALGSARVERFAEDQMVVDLNIRGAGILVVANSYDPDWSVSIDGKSRSLAPVYGALWGVKVEPGDKQAVFRFTPRYTHLNHLF